MQSLIPWASLLFALSGQVETTPTDDPAVIDGCFLVAFQRVPVASVEAGMLASVDVKEGDDVTENQLVARINDDELVKAADMAKFEYLSKKLQAENELSVQAYVLAEGVAKAEWDAAQAANRKVPGSVSEFELRRLELTYKRSGIQKDLERYTLDIASWDAQAAYAKYQQTMVMVERRRLKAPHNGIVEKVLRYKGDWVTPGDPVVQLTRIDRLRVEGRVSAARYHPSDVDRRQAEVRVNLAGSDGGKTVTLRGVKVVASYVIEEDTSFRVLAEIENKKQDSKWLLSPGMCATIVLQAP